MLTLYYAPGACSLASHIALEEAGLPFEVRKLDLAAGDQRAPDYLALNPKGRVPALATPEGLLTESPAILAYIAELAPQAQLLPQAPFARAKALSHLSYFSGTVHGNAFASLFRPARFTADEAAFDSLKAKARADLPGQYFPEIEALLAGREWVMDHFTVVDLYPLVFRRWALRAGFDMAAFPAWAAHAARLAARPAVEAALAREQIRLDG